MQLRVELKKIFISCFILIPVIFSTQISGCVAVKKYDHIRNISFSHDGKMILFDRYRHDHPALIHVYNLETEALAIYKPTQGEGWYMPKYSFDGKNIAIITIPENRESGKLQKDLANAQIVIIGPDGNNLKRITKNIGWKVYPSFSHDNKKLIYTKADTLGKRVVAVGYDVYEVDIESGVEERLTWFRFGDMSAPFYLPGDETFIFSAFNTPYMYPGVERGDSKGVLRKKAEIEEKYESIMGTTAVGENIYVCKKGQKELPDFFVKPRKGYNGYHQSPQVAVDNMIFFKYGNQIVMKYAPDGNHRLINKPTKNKPIPIQSYAVSNDGTSLAISMRIPDTEIEKDAIMIYRVYDGVKIREIILQDTEVSIINK